MPNLRTPTRLDSLLFVALMSGPPQLNLEREVGASLTGQIDTIALYRIGVWLCGGLWTMASLYSLVLKRGILPRVNAVQVTAGLLIGALSLSLPESPGVLLTGFTLGQYAVMLSFAWVFVHRFGTSVYLRHLFIGTSVLALMIAVSTVISSDFALQGTRLRGDGIASTGIVAVMGLVFCLSNLAPLKPPYLWAMVALFGALLAGSRTRTAYGAFLVYLAIGYAYGRGLRVRKLVPLLAALSFALLALDVLSGTADYIVRDTESLATMSDRIPLWQFLTDVVMREAPMTGLGYYAASRVWAPIYNPALGNAHSAFFEIFLGGGLIAATVYVTLCAMLLWYAARLLTEAGGRPDVVAAVGLVSITLISGLTSLAVHVGPEGFTFWSLSALLPTLHRQYARPAFPRRQRLPGRPFTWRGQATAGGAGATG